MYSLFPAVVAVLFLGYGLHVLKRAGATRSSLSFFLLCLTTFAWQFSWAVLFQVEDPAVADVLVRVGYFFILFLPTSLYHFLVELSGRSSERRWVLASYALAALLATVLFQTPLVVAGYHEYFLGFYPRAGVLHPLHVAQTLVVVLRGLQLMWQTQKLAPPRERIRLRYCVTALLIYLFAAVDYLCNYGVEFYPPGVFFILVSLALLAMAASRHQLMNASLVLSRTLARTVALCVLLGAWTAAWFFVATRVDEPLRFHVMLGCSALLLVLAGEWYRPLWRYLHGFPARLLGRDWRLSQSADAIHAVSHALTRHISLGDMMRDLEHALATNSRLRVRQLFIRDDLSEMPGEAHKGQFVRWDIPQGVADRHSRLPASHPLLRRFRHTEVVHWQDTNGPARVLLRAHDSLTALSIRLDGQLVGVLLVGLDDGITSYSGAELDLLEFVPGQLTLGIDRVHAYARLCHSLNMAQKTASLTSLLAAHHEQLRQHIGILQMYCESGVQEQVLRNEVATQCARMMRQMNDAELDLRARHAVERPLDVNPLLRSAARLSPLGGRTVTLDLDPRLPRLRGNPESLLLLFVNMLRYAGDMVIPGQDDRIAMSTRWRRDTAAIQIVVEGHGAASGRRSTVRADSHAWPRADVDIDVMRRVVAEHRGEIREIAVSGQRVCIDVRLPVTASGAEVTVG